MINQTDILKRQHFCHPDNIKVGENDIGLFPAVFQTPPPVLQTTLINNQTDITINANILLV